MFTPTPSFPSHFLFPPQRHRHRKQNQSRSNLSVLKIIKSPKPKEGEKTTKLNILNMKHILNHSKRCVYGHMGVVMVKRCLV